MICGRRSPRSSRAPGACASAMCSGAIPSATASSRISRTRRAGWGGSSRTCSTSRAWSPARCARSAAGTTSPRSWTTWSGAFARSPAATPSACPYPTTCRRRPAWLRHAHPHHAAAPHRDGSDSVMTMESARILVVDDEPAILRTVRANLGRRGFDVAVASNAEEALASAERGADLVVLDLGLPDRDGLEVIRALRERGDVPIIVLSVRDGEKDKVRALELGADDYLTKPFGVEELVARVRVALRHSARPALDPVFRTGDLVVDLDKRRVFVAGEEVRLTPTEYALLVVLVRNADRVVTDAGLLRQVWGPEYGDEDHYLHVYVARLRKKIERDPQNPRYLRTEPGVGYRLLTESP